MYNSNQSKLFLIVTFTGVLLLVFSCEKEIEVELPPIENNLVVEGRIEQDMPPVIFITNSMGYFEQTTVSGFENTFVHGAIAIVETDNRTDTLEELCLNSIPELYKPFVAQFLGVPPERILSINYCVYTVAFKKFIQANYLKGEVGKSYKLTIIKDDKIYTSSTKIPFQVKLDSVWFKLWGDSKKRGLTYAYLSDPDTFGNAYRWYVKRLNTDIKGKPIESNYAAPSQSVFDDKFINGKTFNFFYGKGKRSNDQIEDDIQNVNGRYYTFGDTIAIKFCSIEPAASRFIQTYEREISSNGNPFASPTSLPTNIKGGALGLWAGYSFTYDTVIAK